MKDFTLKKFAELCETVVANYSTMTFSRYLSCLSSHYLPEKFIIMRHDIDRKINNSLLIAKIEKELGIKSTYYFRMNDDIFRPEIIQEIEGMGHEVGYHYDVLGKTKGNYEKAIKLFGDELKEFRKICNVKTICMHGNPLSKYDNRDLWKIYNFKDFGIIGEAYLSVESNGDVNYFSDTGRWNSKNNVRDFIARNREKIIDDKTIDNKMIDDKTIDNKIIETKIIDNINSTDDLISLITNNKIDRLYILTHPERWSQNNTEWYFNYLKDSIFNVGKKILITTRKFR